MRTLLVGIAAALALATMPGVAGAQSPEEQSAEATFVSRINALRASKGLSTLEVHPNLVAKARDWAATMAGAGAISHSKLSDGITADWQKLGENVGVGPAVEGLHNAFVASPKHYENLVDPQFTQVGIGVVTVGEVIYVSEMFMRLMSRPAPAAAPVPSAPPAPKPAVEQAPVVKQTAVRSVTPPAPVAASPAPRPARAAPSAAPEAPARPSARPSLLLVSVLDRLHRLQW
jgi:cysteine-rich secretory family protein